MMLAEKQIPEPISKEEFIELQKKYFDIACKRIEDAQRQEHLF